MSKIVKYELDQKITIAADWNQYSKSWDFYPRFGDAVYSGEVPVISFQVTRTIEIPEHELVSAKLEKFDEEEEKIRTEFGKELQELKEAKETFLALPAPEETDDAY